MVSKCAVCGHEKSVFVVNTPSKKKQAGKGIVDNFISALPFEAHLLVTDPATGKPTKASFIGPGTRLDKRLLPGTNTPQAWSTPKNALDAAAQRHDIAYRDHKDAASRNRADEVLSNAARAYLQKPGLTTLDKIDAHIVEKAMKLIKRKV